MLRTEIFGGGRGNMIEKGDRRKREVIMKRKDYD